MGNIMSKTYRKITKFLPEPIRQQYRKFKNPFNRFKRRLGSYFDDTKIYLVSYPCSGRTWLRVLIGKTLCDRFSIDEKLMLDTPTLTQKVGIPKSTYTHDCSLVEDYFYYFSDEVFFDITRFLGKKVILLIRDPRDVMVSYYSHLSKRDEKYDGTISEFVRDKKVGIEKLLAFNNLWLENKHLLQDLLIIQYEDLRKESAEVLSKIIAFMEVKNCSNDIIENAIEFASFDNMKKLEKMNYWKDHSRANILQPRTSKPDSSKVRKGKVGGFSDSLSAEDIEFIDRLITEFNFSFYQ